MYGEKQSALLTLDDIKPYLKNMKINHDGEIRCGCPICETQDAKPHHLYIKATPDNLILYCQKCKANGSELIKRFREMGAKHEVTVINTEPAKIVENYAHEYRNPDGSIAYYKQRVKYSNGHKEFRFYYFDENGKKIYSKPDGCNVIYNLDLMQVASEQEEIPCLFIVEGEKNADAMVSRGLLAISSNTGAKSSIKFSERDLEMLSRFPRKVVINDNDQPGEEYVKAWPDAEWLPITELWPDCPPKGDVADYFDAGHGITEIESWRPFNIDAEIINNLELQELISDDVMNALFKIKDKAERQKMLIFAEQRAKDVGLNSKNFKELWKAFLEKQAKNTRGNGNYTRFQNAPVENLKCGEWIADMTGVYVLKKNESDELVKEYASMIPIVPSSILENQDDGTEKIAVSFYKKNTWRTVNIQKGVLMNAQKILALADIGVDVSSLTAKLLVKYLSDVINLNEGGALQTIKTVSHLGWYGNEFIPYSNEIKTDMDRDYSHLLNCIKNKGTLEEWVDFIKPMRENKALRLFVNASFASVLIGKTNGLSFFLHLWGTSGFGKTVTLMLSASVWGSPREGDLVIPLNSTLNYTCRLASVLKNLPLCANELQTIKVKGNENYDRFIMTLSEGEEKGRLSKEIVVRQKGTWKLCILTTGEEPLVKSDSGGGAVNRVIELRCNKAIVNETTGPKVVSYITEHYGVAGKRFIEILPSDDVLRESFKKWQSAFSVVDSTSKQKMAMSLLALTDEITSRELFHDEPLSVDDYVEFMKTEQEVDASERAWEILQGMITENIANFNVVGAEGQVRSGLKLWGRLTEEYVYFVPGILKEEFKKKGYRFDDYKQVWSEKGYIKKSGKNYNIPIPLEKGGKARGCVMINRGDWL